jgi:dienelactone hydrolase
MEDVKRKADEFAGHGYLALAPDLFEGKFWLGCAPAGIRRGGRQLR